MIGEERRQGSSGPLGASGMREPHAVDRAVVAVYLSENLNLHFSSECFRSIVSTSTVLSVNIV